MFATVSEGRGYYLLRQLMSRLCLARQRFMRFLAKLWLMSKPTPLKASPGSLSGLMPFLVPYHVRIALALLFLVLAAVATLAFPVALRYLIDGGLVQADKGAQVMALREHFVALFAVAVALGLFSAGRFYMVSWLGERVTADLRNAVYAHVLQQSPEFFETTQTGEVLSRLSADTTLVQTVVGSSLSMGLRNTVMGIGALGMLIWTNPYVMFQAVSYTHLRAHETRHDLVCRLLLEKK